MTAVGAHRIARRRKGWGRALVLLLPILALGGKCGGGDGSSGPPPVVQSANIDARCLTIAGKFPSGFDMIPDEPALATVVQFFPQAILGLDLDTEPPSLVSPSPIPVLPPDSDGDGTEDGQQVRDAGFRFPLRPVLGRVVALGRDVALVSSSNFEELIVWNPLNGELIEVAVENPVTAGEHDAADFPFLPAEGTVAMRTALSTKRCVYPPDPTDSLGDPVEVDDHCSPDRPGYLTRLTAGAALAGDRLFVATSNLKRSNESRFYPGSVLVYRLELDRTPIRLRPDTDVPVVFTSGFNPTQLASHRTRSGRELILVMVTGAIGLESGPDNVKTESFVDAIDVESGLRVATIPMGRAGLFNQIAVAPSGRVAVMGASSQRHLYAVDLAALDDPTLYPPLDDPPRLDGTTPGFPDARIFDSLHPFEIPARDGGPDPATCAGRTDVTFNAAGSRVYVTDICDGTLSVVGADLGGDPPIPVPRDRFSLERVEPVLAPLVPESIGKLRSPSMIRVRPGRPGEDFTGPDVYFVAGEPEGSVCGVRIESQAP